MFGNGGERTHHHTKALLEVLNVQNNRCLCGFQVEFGSFSLDRAVGTTCYLLFAACGQNKIEEDRSLVVLFDVICVHIT